MAVAARMVSGRVVSANPKGVKLDGHDDWFNFSKWSDADHRDAVAVGMTVDLTLDAAGFVRRCVAAGAPTTGAAHLTPGRPTPASEKDRTITRLAVLKAAAEFSASKPSSSSADVLKIAASWERWILRGDDDTDDDLTDAF